MTSNTDTFNYLHSPGEKVKLIIVAAFFFASVFIHFSGPLTTGDFWWHLATGKYIYEKGGLPSEDPFTYTTSETPDKRKEVILKGFWLSQLSFYSVYKAFGFPGTVIFKALLFSSVFYILWRVMVQNGIESYASLVLILPLSLISNLFESLRPQLFSFIGTLLIFACIDYGLKKLRDTEELGAIVFAPLIMLLWANLHRGYIVGYAVIGIYVATESLRYLFMKEPLSKRAFIKFSLISALSLVVSLLNPTLWHALPVNLWELGYSISVSTIDEYLSPWKYSSYVNAEYFPIALLALFLTTVSFMFISWRKINIAHVILYAGFTWAAIDSFRFCIFFIIMSMAISSRYISIVAGNVINRFKRFSSILALAMALLLIISSLGNSFLFRGPLSKTLPVEAADFIEKRSLPAPLFNPYRYGGYLIWRLHPNYKVFIDERSLDNRSLIEHMTVQMGKKGEIFDRYGINTVVYYPFDPYTFNMPGLVISLLKDFDWRLVYYDRNSVIFIRTKSMPTITSINKEHLWESLIFTAESLAEKLPDNPKPYKLLSQIFAARGETEKSKKYLRLSQEKIER